MGFVILALTAAIWFSTALQAELMARAFIRRHPEEARAAFAGPWYSDARRLLVFFGRRKLPIVCEDPEINRMRRRVKVLAVLSLFPFVTVCGAAAVISVLLLVGRQ